MEVPSMLLQDLPTKLSHRVRRSVTWTDVDIAARTRTRFRRILARVTHPGWHAPEWRAAAIRLIKGS
jgi:hypothetical protein